MTNQTKFSFLFIIGLFLVSGFKTVAQQPTPTPILYSEKTLNELKRIQTAALESDYAYRQGVGSVMAVLACGLANLEQNLPR